MSKLKSSVYQPIDDDTVLQAMTQLGLDAECEVTFRSVRHYLSYGIPLCCIAFMEYYTKNIPYIDYDKAWDAATDDGASRLKQGLAWAVIGHYEYQTWIYDKLAVLNEEMINYNPCSSCVLSGNIYDIPDGCPCCSDKAKYPSPEELST